MTIRTVARLRAVVMGARRDPTVETYRYWRIREWDDADDPAACLACGRDYVPAQISDEDCTCGGHRVWRHDGRWADVVIPPRGPGCAPLPLDPDARQVAWRSAR